MVSPILLFITLSPYSYLLREYLQASMWFYLVDVTYSSIGTFFPQHLCAQFFSHFRDLSTRSSSALIKSILVDFLKRNYLSLPSEEVIISSVLPGLQQQENDYTLFDRLFFIAIVLCSVFPGPITLTTSQKSDHNANNPTSLPITKPQYMLSVALQALVGSLMVTLLTI